MAKSLWCLVGLSKTSWNRMSKEAQGRALSAVGICPLCLKQLSDAWVVASHVRSTHKEAK